MPYRLTRWDDDKVRRIAKRLTEGVSAHAIAKSQGVTIDKVRAEVVRVLGRAWWAEHIIPSRGRSAQ